MKNKFEAGVILVVSILLIAILDAYFQIEQTTIPIWQTDWFLWRVYGVVIILLFVTFYVWYVRVQKAKRVQEQFAKQLVEIKEDDSRRIAAELHDSLGQNLQVINSSIMRTVNSMSDSDPVKEKLKGISEMVKDSISDVREISSNLYPHILENLGIKKAIESLITKIEDASGICFDYSIDNIDGILNSYAEINLYRIIQEIINNIAKHSKAGNASVNIRKDYSYIYINIKDNGTGIIKDENHSGAGMLNLRERVKMLKGKISINSNKEGTNINIVIKLKGSILS
ncbi:MAG: sensor histidine kinase [Ignavibacteriae bacterium]|nr:MAG: sensor histidine kinase [Ignavibacteriota bacterium]